MFVPCECCVFSVRDLCVEMNECDREAPQRDIIAQNRVEEPQEKKSYTHYVVRITLVFFR